METIKKEKEIKMKTLTKKELKKVKGGVNHLNVIIPPFNNGIEDA